MAEWIRWWARGRTEQYQKAKAEWATDSKGWVTHEVSESASAAHTLILECETKIKSAFTKSIPSLFQYPNLLSRENSYKLINDGLINTHKQNNIYLLG